MVERVARALVRKRVELEIEADGFAVPTNPEFYADLVVDEADRAEARAAIEAMREPTEEMLKAAFVAMNETPSGTWKAMKAEGVTPRRLFDVKQAPRWRAMIDAALNTPGHAEPPAKPREDQ
jgi:hypothetical protein